MNRVFIALPVPPELRTRLQAWQPSESPGVRPVPPDNMHLTLRFLGPGDIDVLASVLDHLTADGFSVPFTRLGRFASRRQGMLWAGLQATPALLSLHNQLNCLLGKRGLATDERPFVPHITLARFRPRCRREAFRHLAEDAPLPLPPLPAHQVVLYSSHQVAGRPCYRPQYVRPLPPP